MKNPTIAILIFGDTNANRNALTEEKYSALAKAFIEKGFRVDSVVYNDLLADKLATTLLPFDAILVWVNPIEQGNDRKKLDALLSDLSNKGCFVSAHPEVILKIGTKDILYKTKDLAFGSDTKLYDSFDDFRNNFPDHNQKLGLRILKQYRGNGGNGVFKVDTTAIDQNKISITHATGDLGERQLTIADFFEEMKIYFQNKGMLIDQAWNPNIINGLVRCYLTGTKVNGFGYQEINALYPTTHKIPKKPSKRFYFTEDCGLFQDLRVIMETKWVPQLQELTAIKTDMMPVIWDADFFINTINTKNVHEKYTLCEINASCVSPFPESAIPFIVEEVIHRIAAKKLS
jgi:hypothetical protein